MKLVLSVYLHTTLTTQGAGEFLGELSLLNEGRRTASATATSECHLLRIGRRDFLDLLGEDIVHIFTKRHF